MNEEDLTPDMHALLRNFDSGGFRQQELAFLDRLNALNYAYTPASIYQLDQLLQQVRTELTAPYVDFITKPANARFVMLAAAMVAETVGLYLGERCKWSKRSRLEALFKEQGPSAQLPEPGFGTMVVCEVGDAGFGLPFAAVEGCLFNHNSVNGMLGWADRLMQRSIACRIIEPSQWHGARTGDLFLVGLNAGHCAAFCIHSALVNGRPFEPTLLRQGEGETFVNWLDLSAHEAVGQGDAALQTPPLGVRRQVLAYDGNVRLEQYRPDGVVLDAAAYAMHGHRPVARSAERLRIALPYRPSTQGFALHKARVADFTGTDDELAELAAGFFHGLDDVSPVWDRYFEDESSPRNMRQRTAALAKRPWSTR